MGDIQSRIYNNNQFEIEDAQQQQRERGGSFGKAIIFQICEDIASGTEADMIDMQCKIAQDEKSSHLFSQSVRESSLSTNNSEESIFSGIIDAKDYLYHSQTQEDIQGIFQEEDFSEDAVKQSLIRRAASYPSDQYNHKDKLIESERLMKLRE